MPVIWDSALPSPLRVETLENFLRKFDESGFVGGPSYEERGK